MVHAAGCGRLSVHARRTDRPAPARIRLVARDHLDRGLDQPHALRSLRAVRWWTDGALRRSPGGRGSAVDGLRGIRTDVLHASAMAARPAVGRRGGGWHRLDGDGAGCHRRQPLVRAAARTRPGRAHCRRGDRPADLSARARLACGEHRVASGGSRSGGRVSARDTARRAVHARPAGGRRPARVRRHGGRRAGAAAAETCACGAWRSSDGRAQSQLLVARGQLLHLRRKHQWTDRDASDPSLDRPRDAGGDCRKPAGLHRDLRRGRDHDLWMADRPPGLALAAVLVLRAARTVAAVLALRVRHAVLRTVPFHRLLWTGLGGDGAADGGPDRGHIWKAQPGSRLRLDLRVPSAGRGRRCIRGGRGAHVFRGLPAGLHDFRPALPARSRACDPYRTGRPAPRGRGGAAACSVVLRRLVLAGGAGAALALLPVSVFAHAQLIVSNPAAGATVVSLPATVELFFTEPVTPAGRGISVYGPDGRLVSSETARAQGNRLSTALTTPGIEGTYAVLWTVVAADTHPSRGEFTFSVGHSGPVKAPGLGGGDVGLVSPIGLVLQALGRWLHFAGFALGFGSAISALFVPKDPRPLRLAGAGVVLLLVAEPLALLAQTASFDPSQTFDGDALIGALASPFGRVLGLRVAAALGLWAVLGALRQAPRLRWAIPTLGLALGMVDATAAHATPALPQALGVALNGLHVSAMGVWLGGLAAFVVAPSSGFGRVAAWSAGLLVASGMALALLHFANPLETMTTAYGGVLMVKLLLVAVALWLAWRGRRRWELGALAGVLVAAAVLVSLPPPR